MADSKKTELFDSNRLFSLHGSVVALVSGGGDSVAMLRYLLEAGNQVHAVHFNHKLRKCSDLDRDFVADLCREWKVPATIVDAGVDSFTTGNVQSQARNWRYANAERIRAAVRANWIATGHTFDDALETRILQIERGRNPAYAYGMLSVRGAVVRPVLNVRRAQLREFLRERNIAWREDPSNESDSYERNTVRKRLAKMAQTSLSRISLELSESSSAYLQARKLVMVATNASPLTCICLDMRTFHRGVPEHVLKMAIAFYLQSRGVVFRESELDQLLEMIQLRQRFKVERATGTIEYLQGRLWAWKEEALRTLSRTTEERRRRFSESLDILARNGLDKKEKVLIPTVACGKPLTNRVLIGPVHRKWTELLRVQGVPSRLREFCHWTVCDNKIVLEWSLDNGHFRSFHLVP
jgi:tRNA(Ile)-lysidine synthetase-like protein